MQCLQFSRNKEELASSSSTPEGVYPQSCQCHDEGQLQAYTHLPPLCREDQGKKTLVLDLDETLVHSSFKPVQYYDFSIQVEVEGKSCIVYVIKRPGVDRFLQTVARKFEVVLFTASLKKYADPLLDMLDVYNCIRHRRYREACRPIDGGFVKDLSLLGRDLSQVLIIDNSAHSYMLQPANAIPIGTFIDDPQDRQLLELLPHLDVIAKMESVFSPPPYRHREEYS